MIWIFAVMAGCLPAVHRENLTLGIVHKDFDQNFSIPALIVDTRSLYHFIHFLGPRPTKCFLECIIKAHSANKYALSESQRRCCYKHTVCFWCLSVTDKLTEL